MIVSPEEECIIKTIRLALDASSLGNEVGRTQIGGKLYKVHVRIPDEEPQNIYIRVICKDPEPVSLRPDIKPMPKPAEVSP